MMNSSIFLECFTVDPLQIRGPDFMKNMRAGAKILKKMVLVLTSCTTAVRAPLWYHACQYKTIPVHGTHKYTLPDCQARFQAHRWSRELGTSR